LATRVEDISDEHLLEAYMGGLKKDIKHELFLIHPTNVMESMQPAHHIQSKNRATHRSTIGAYRGRRHRFGVHKTSISQLKRLAPQQMDQRREKVLCFNCDSKYNNGHKCGENKLLYIDCEQEEDQELEPPQDPDLEETTPTIYWHALANINTRQTLKIQGYINKKKVTILIDSDNTHIFINYKLEKDLNCFVYPEP
jgi:hypothetical protein